MPTLWQDLRFGLRMLRKSPGFTAVAILTLAVGLGVNATAFSIVNGFLFRGLAVPHPSGMVSFGFAIDRRSHSNRTRSAYSRGDLAPESCRQAFLGAHARSRRQNRLGARTGNRRRH